MATKDKWKIFAMRTCFSTEMTDAECIEHFNAIEETDSPDDAKTYLDDVDLIPWHLFEYMHDGEFIEFIMAHAQYAQDVAGESNINVTHLVGGWKVSTDDTGQYLYVERDGAPGQIHIKAEDEGFVVDLWDSKLENCTASAAATYTELEPE